MTAAAADERIEQPVAKTAASQIVSSRTRPTVASATPPAFGRNRISKLVRFAPASSTRCIQQHAHRHARLDLEHLQKQFFQAQVGAPVHRAQIVAMMEMAMIQKLLAGAGKARDVVATDQPGERLLPVDGQPFQLLQKWRSSSGSGIVRSLLRRDAATVTPLNDLVRIVSGVCPSAWASKFRMMRWRNTPAPMCRMSSTLRCKRPRISASTRPHSTSACAPRGELP